jgi:hypothetical protein
MFAARAGSSLLRGRERCESGMDVADFRAIVRVPGRLRFVSNVMIRHDLLRISAALRRHPMNRGAFRKDEQANSNRVGSTEKKMTKNNTAQSSENARRCEPNLDSRYGQIGISAVAAALQYQSEVKNPAYAPSVHEIDKWIAEMAA